MTRVFDQFLRDSLERVNGTHTATFVYDDDGLLTGAGGLSIHRRADNGQIDSTAIGVVTSSLAYDAHGELVELHYRVNGAAHFHQQLGRDSLGRVVRIAETREGVTHVHEYRYDVAGRLDQVKRDGAVVATYGYDGGAAGNGNRTSYAGASANDTASATYDAQDRMVRYGDATYRYTANGELVQRRSSTDSLAVTYDALGNLVKATLATGDSLTYVIDGANRRVARKRNGATTRRWLYANALNVVAELDSTGAVVNRYVYGTLGHVPDVMVSGGVPYRLITDQLGSVRAVVNTNTGAVVQRTDYDAWGVRTLDESPGLQSLGFAGGLTDPETKLVRFGARDYEPAVGRWTSKDPVGFGGGDAGLYTYVANAPVEAIDPEGLEGVGPYRNGFPRDRLPRLALPPSPQEIERMAREERDTERRAGRIPEGYENAYLHALGGEYARRYYGVALARCGNELKEFFDDRYHDRHATSETNRDWRNTETGIQGRHRRPDGSPDTTGLLPDSPVFPPLRY